MAKRSTSAFPPVLNEPILKATMFDFGQIPGATESDREAAYESRLYELQYEKLLTLFAHYKIPISSELRWSYLAYCLACDFFPGMEVVTKISKRARPREKWGTELQWLFKDVVDKVLAEQPKLKIAAAIDIARQRDPQRWGAYKTSTLETRYYELKKKGPRELLDLSKFMLAEFLPKKS
jgi:hypothetical protein